MSSDYKIETYESFCLIRFNKAKNNQKEEWLSHTAAYLSKHLKLPVNVAYKDIGIYGHVKIDQIKNLLQDFNEVNEDDDSKVIEIPACYHPSLSPDYERIGQRLRLSWDEIASIHSSTTYKVAAVGFLPGFPYLTGLDERLHLPRLISPRTQVPANSLAMAENLSCVYPRTSPGGWNIIGRINHPLWDENRAQPALLKVGDRVRFIPVELSEFQTNLEL